MTLRDRVPEARSNWMNVCLEVIVGGCGSSSGSGYTAEKGIELLIITLAVEKAGVELVIDLLWGLGCSLGGTGSTVFAEGDETGQRKETRSFTLIQASWGEKLQF